MASTAPKSAPLPRGFPPPPPPPPMSSTSVNRTSAAQQSQSQLQSKSHSKPATTPAPPKPTISYEKYAPRSQSQLERLAKIAELTAGPAERASKAQQKTKTKTKTKTNHKHENYIMTCMTPPSSSAPASFQLRGTTTPISSSTEEDESQPQYSRASEDPILQTLTKAFEASDQMTTVMKHTTSLRLALRASINIADDISNRHAELLRHSGELSAAADRLQAEEEMLSRHAEEIGKPLQHYDAVDRIGVLVGVLFKGKHVVQGLAKIKVDHEDFSLLLDEIDEAVEFFGNESGGMAVLQEEMKRRMRSSARGGDDPHNHTAQQLSGSIEYFRRALALQDAALSLIREAVVDRMTQTTSDVAGSLNIPKVPIAADKLEASLVYTRFHGISSRSNRLLTLVRTRVGRGDAYQELLGLCRNTYCTSREKLLRMTIRAHMDKLKAQHGLVGMTRLASVFLIRICTIETSLFQDFFGEHTKTKTKPTTTATAEDTTASSSEEEKTAAAADINPPPNDGNFTDGDFQGYLGTLCSALHRTVRRGLVSIVDLDTLCQIVSVLREERSLASNSPTTMAAARAISSVIADAQERLIFCANSALMKEVIRFKATPQDLNYPEKLMTSSSSTVGSEGPTTATAAATENNDDDAVQQQLQVYESWFPPMRSVLRILSKIFRVVEPRVFEDIARESVQACTRCLKDGAAYIMQRSGVRHADLFLVKHLLILREQLSPFDIELRSVERQLDFSDAGKAVSRFLANRNRRLFSMSTENALVTLLREGVSVQEADVDSKRDLEDSLRSACNDFIEHTSKSIAADLFLLIDQCKGHVASGGTATLKSQPFMNGETVQSIFDRTLLSLEEHVSDVTSQMSLYLDNPATQSILLKPVNRKITRALEEARRYIGETKDGENGWEEELRSNVLGMTTDVESEVKRAIKTYR